MTQPLTAAQWEIIKHLFIAREPDVEDDESDD